MKTTIKIGRSYFDHNGNIWEIVQSPHTRGDDVFVGELIHLVKDDVALKVRDDRTGMSGWNREFWYSDSKTRHAIDKHTNTHIIDKVFTKEVTPEEYPEYFI